jgi:hypothetical protein
VVAGMIGYHSGHAEYVAAQAGTTWKRYAVGDQPAPPIDSSNPDGGEYWQPTNPSGRSTTRPNASSASPDTDAC